MFSVDGVWIMVIVVWNDEMIDKCSGFWVSGYMLMLIVVFLYFDFVFMVWVLFGLFVLEIVKMLVLIFVEKGLMVVVLMLVGVLLCVVNGLLVD